MNGRGVLAPHRALPGEPHHSHIGERERGLTEGEQGPVTTVVNRRPPLHGGWAKISHDLTEFRAGRIDARTKFTGLVSFEPLSFFKLTLYLKPSLIVRKLAMNRELGFEVRFGRGVVNSGEVLGPWMLDSCSKLGRITNPPAWNRRGCSRLLS